MAQSLLTPTALRWSPLSTAGGKEGKNVFFYLTVPFPPALFAACGREGRSSAAMIG